MKKNLLISSLLVVLISFQGITLLAQDEEIPTAVQATFNTMYPNAIDAYWEQDGEEYLATFAFGEKSIDATFLEDGTWQQSVISLEFEDLPAAAITLLDKDFKTASYFSISRVQIPAQVQYSVSFETDTQYVTIIFDTAGQLVDKQVEDL